MISTTSANPYPKCLVHERAYVPTMTFMPRSRSPISSTPVDACVTGIIEHKSIEVTSGQNPHHGFEMLYIYWCGSSLDKIHLTCKSIERTTLSISAMALQTHPFDTLSRDILSAAHCQKYIPRR
ncbi:hypothetical protein ASPWEDRAFT_40318 [Aspergillus wentii DTO 134E9]|uniref:Uncharacterized protein n=1 Tax=Aspergillus wentii DTO 134E9 TaxID=1073089 RepID=A0A1L9RJR8_ASPWE|nr:uncharacterized protein ASPWEDRAFT_40318 [Aspergillus wentii DTO 134E9]OJJ35144.1 hypothetical protein ASPWEDRAFT_40318 [Aspergillus wentii DTO 134E9]